MLSKLSKAVDKVMPPDIGKAVHSVEFPPELLNQVLQHTTSYCKTLEHTSVHRNTMQYTATYCRTVNTH